MDLIRNIVFIHRPSYQYSIPEFRTEAEPECADGLNIGDLRRTTETIAYIINARELSRPHWDRPDRSPANSTGSWTPDDPRWKKEAR